MPLSPEDVRQAYLQGENVWVALHLGRKSGSKPCSIIAWYAAAQRSNVPESVWRCVLMAQCISLLRARRSAACSALTLAIPLKG